MAPVMHRPTGHTVKRSGVTRSAVQQSHRNGLRHAKRLTSTHQQKRKEKAQAARRAIIESLEEPTRHAIAAMDVDSGHGSHDVDAVASVLPPGEAGLDYHDDGDDNDNDELDVEGLFASIEPRSRWASDPRTRRNRGENEQNFWKDQIDYLTNAYLKFGHQHSDDIPQTFPVASNSMGNLELWDISRKVVVSVTLQDGHKYVNETLLSFGYIASCPLRPTLAFSLRTLKFYRQTHRTCPRLSIEAFTRSLSYTLSTPFSPYLAVQFSHAYDAFLLISRRVDHYIDVALGRDQPNWHIKNACPACFYSVENEPELRFNAFVSMDGNNSLRRVSASMHAQDRVDHLDTRTIDSDWWLTPEDVDRFKDEVQTPSTINADTADHRQARTAIADDLRTSASFAQCKDRFRNAKPSERKRMFALFEETGIFIASCRHRLVLVGCDMVRSGEQYKYPYAVVNKMLNVLDPRLNCAYDIGCEFEGSLQNSTLAGLAKAKDFHLSVGAFHGYAHNRTCQLNYHPLYTVGAGNFDGEGCEHIFSSSNDLARATRHATKFHRRQAIEEHFSFWNQDKYALLSTYIANHYREALKRIRTYSLLFHQMNATLKLTFQDIEDDLVHERIYFAQLGVGVGLREHFQREYVNALEVVKHQRLEWLDYRTRANSALSSVSQTCLADIRHATTMLDLTYDRIKATEENIAFLEKTLDIQQQWTSTHPDYIKCHQENIATSYHQALTELERLVVSRFSELAKMSMPGLGYKQRTKISKSLTKRSETIRKAIDRYNTQALKLTPPRETLTWQNIADITILGDFDVLRLPGLDITLHPWALSKRRTAANAYFKIRRAQEEITRLNVEICRLRTWIADEEVVMKTTITSLQSTNTILATELARRWTLRSQVNQDHIEKLTALTRLPGFTGSIDIGTRRTHTSPPSQAPLSATPSSSTPPPQSFNVPNATASNDPIPLNLPSPTQLAPQPHLNSTGGLSGAVDEGDEDDDDDDDDDWYDDEGVPDYIQDDSMDMLADYLVRTNM